MATYPIEIFLFYPIKLKNRTAHDSNLELKEIQGWKKCVFGVWWYGMRMNGKRKWNWNECNLILIWCSLFYLIFHFLSANFRRKINIIFSFVNNKLIKIWRRSLFRLCVSREGAQPQTRHKKDEPKSHCIERKGLIARSWSGNYSQQPKTTNLITNHHIVTSSLCSLKRYPCARL